MNIKRLERGVSRRMIVSYTIAKKRMSGLPKNYTNRLVRKINKDYKRKPEMTRAEQLDAYKHGFDSISYNRYNLRENDYSDYISDFEFDFVQSINNYFGFWLSNKIVQRTILQNYSELFAPMYYYMVRITGEKKIYNCITKKTETVEEFYESLKKLGKVVISPARVSKNKFYIVEAEDDILFINDIEAEVDDLEIMVKSFRDITYIITPFVQAAPGLCEALECNDAVYRFIALTDADNNTKLMSCDLLASERPVVRKRPQDILCDVDLEDGTIQCGFPLSHSDYCSVPWQEICDKVKELANYISVAEFASFYVKPTEDGYLIEQLQKVQCLPATATKGTPLYDYIKGLYDYKWNAYKKGDIKLTASFKTKMLRKYSKKHLKRGIRPYMAGLYLNTIKDDFLHTEKPIKDKLWAWRRGFPSYRIDQYGLTEDNWKDIMSDLDYAWLNRLNNYYRLLVDDKLSLRYTLEPYKQYLPGYYYLIERRRDKRHLKPLVDLPEKYPNSKEGILMLIRDKGKLAFKPANGTHGDGFYKLEYGEDGSYYVNGDPATPEELLEVIYTQKSIYCITEYVEMHPQLKAIYPASVNTIRVMVINRDLDHPTIEHAYMRIGSSKTGFTDNIGYGGLCCYMDVKTGRYYNGQFIQNHKFHSCEVHPDTGVSLEGYVPHWDTVCDAILDICRLVPMVEYLGFDIAVTEDSFSIIEINIHQDLHKYIEYPDSVKEFFKHKIEYKERVYGLRKKEDPEEEPEEGTEEEGATEEPTFKDTDGDTPGSVI